MQRWLRFSVSLMIACFGLIVIGRALVTYAQLDNRRGVVETRSSFSSTPNFPNCRFGVGGDTQAL